MYISEAQEKHMRLLGGVPISEPTLLALQGSDSRREPRRNDLWDQLQLKIDSHHLGVALARRARGPVGGSFTCGFATNVLLREIELALLDLHSDTISFDVLAATVVVRLCASKNDLRRRTAASTHKCRCHKLGRVFCPFCSAFFVLAALEIVQLRRQDRHHSSGLVKTLEEVPSWTTHMSLDTKCEDWGQTADEFEIAVN